MKLSPFFGYYGGKHIAAKSFPKPIHKQIVEPFAGSAGYACQYSHHEVLLNDLDPIIAGIWDYLIHAKEAEIRSLPDQVKDIAELNGKTPQEAKDLIGFWLAVGRCKPATKLTSRQASKVQVKHIGTWKWERKMIISNQLKHIRHWKITCKDYKSTPDIKATWFIDPPYNNKAGKAYTHKFTEFDDLGKWIQTRQGQLIVCEQHGAQWMDFKTFKETPVSTGKSKEVVYVKGCSRLFPHL